VAWYRKYEPTYAVKLGILAISALLSNLLMDVQVVVHTIQSIMNNGRPQLLSVYLAVDRPEFGPLFQYPSPRSRFRIVERDVVHEF
jgi:hypothetical protein